MTETITRDAITEAIRGSIAKWEAIVAGTGTDQGAINCPLCEMFAHDINCAGCPVAERTGKPDCVGSPYYTYQRNRTKKAAQAELDFLKSILAEHLAGAAP